MSVWIQMLSGVKEIKWFCVRNLELRFITGPKVIRAVPTTVVVAVALSPTS